MMNPDQLFEYSAQGNNGELEKLIANGANLHMKNAAGDYALHVAATHGHAQTVQLLLDAGCHVYATNRSGHTALIVAAMKCHSEVVKVILEFSKKISDRKNPSVVAALAANSLDAQGCSDVSEMLRSNPG